MAERLREHLSQMWQEDAIFQRLMYKNKSQHRRTFYFRWLHQVQRFLKLLNTAASDDLLTAITRHLQSTSSRKPDKAAKLETKESVLNSLLGMSRILHEIESPILNASRQVAGLLEQCYFMPFAVSVLSVMARVRVLSFQLLSDTVAIYNLLAKDVYCGSSLIPFSKLQQELPSSLECKWKDSRYQLTEVKADAATWFVDDHSDVQPKENTSKILYRSAGKELVSMTKTSGSQSRINKPAELTKSITLTSVNGLAAVNTLTPVDKSAAALTPVNKLTAVKQSTPEAADFLDFMERPRNKRVAYIAVGGGIDKPTPEKDDGKGVEKRDTLFDLLVSGRNNESIF